VRVLIVGCGYVGVALGRQLVSGGHEVFGMRRSLDSAAELTAEGIHPVVGDVTDMATLDALGGTFDWVANTVSSSRGDSAVYRQVYWEGTRNLIPWLRERGCQRYAYTSSTSVYAQCDGTVVTEDSATEPAAETARILVQAENELRQATPSLPFAAGIFRVAGIYGPGRGHLYQQYLRDEARLVGDGSRLINMIHRDDVASALKAFFDAPRLPSGARIYNAVDDAPVTQLEFFQWLSHRLGKPLPPPAPISTAGDRKRAATQKRVSNQRLRHELNWFPHYPTFRDGYEAIIATASA